MVNWLPIDKALIYWDDMALTQTGDFQVVSGYECILQAAQNRVISYLETRKFDTRFWDDLPRAMHNIPPSKITDNMVGGYVKYALQPMISDGRITNVDSVKIVYRTRDSITIEIILTLWTFNGSVVVELPIFIS